MKPLINGHHQFDIMQLVDGRYRHLVFWRRQMGLGYGHRQWEPNTSWWGILAEAKRRRNP